ncbi:MAG: hypothetical protein R3C05_18085 [Pirellulaceae bacterium]
MTSDLSLTNCYRCPVAAEKAKAWLQMGHRRVNVTMLDTSIEGFTIVIRPKDVRLLRYDVTWTLTTCDEKCIVHPEWMYNADATSGQLGLRRVRDVTPSRMRRKHSAWFMGGAFRGGESDLSGLALGGMLMLIVAILTLPGIGDDLGTAPRIQSLLQDGFRSVASSIQSFLNS